MSIDRENMPKTSAAVSSSNPSMKFVMTFFVMAAVNAVVIFLANMFFPSQVVLGTMSISHTWAVVLSAGTLAWFTMLFFPLVKSWELSKKRNLTPTEMMAAYLVINFVGLWSVTRVSELFGLGLSSWVVVLILAVVLDFLQGMAVMLMDSTGN